MPTVERRCSGQPDGPGPRLVLPAAPWGLLPSGECDGRVESTDSSSWLRRSI